MFICSLVTSLTLLSVLVESNDRVGMKLADQEIQNSGRERVG